MIKAILFDLDGVLVDAADWHYQALNRALGLFGYSLTAADHALNFNGLPTHAKLDLLSQQRGLPRSLHAFIAEMKQKYTRDIVDSECRPSEALAQLLTRLKAQGVKLAVATNCARETLDRVTDALGITALLDIRLSHEEMNEPKPSPEIYLACFHRLGVTAPECLIVEDSGPGIQAARAAGAHVMVVRGPAEVTWERLRREIAAAETAGATPDHAAPTPELQIVVPMAGQGQRFVAAGYVDPKPFIDLFGKRMISWVIDNVRPSATPHRFTFLCNEQHLRQFNMEAILREAAPGCRVVSVPALTQGAACTVLLAADGLNPNWPLLLANSDQWVEFAIDEFLGKAFATGCDGSILTFPANHPKWSYAKLDGHGRVTEVAEKTPISPHATVGIYYFRRAGDFIEGAKAMVRKNLRVNGEFYVCPVYNEVIGQGKDIRIQEIPADAMHGLGTPEDLDVFRQWHQSERHQGV